MYSNALWKYWVAPVDFAALHWYVSMCVRNVHMMIWLRYVGKRRWILRCLFPHKMTASCQEAQRHCRLRFNLAYRVMWLRNVRSTVTTIWQMPRHCWNPLPAVSVTSTDANTMYVSTPFPSLYDDHRHSGVKGMDKLFDFANRVCLLWSTLTADDECADYCIVMFSKPLPARSLYQNLFTMEVSPA